MRRGELHIGGAVVFTTILRVVTTQNTRTHTKFRQHAQFTKKKCVTTNVLRVPKQNRSPQRFEPDQTVTRNHIWYAKKVVLYGK